MRLRVMPGNLAVFRDRHGVQPTGYRLDMVVAPEPGDRLDLLEYAMANNRMVVISIAED